MVSSSKVHYFTMVVSEVVWSLSDSSGSSVGDMIGRSDLIRNMRRRIVVLRWRRIGVLRKRNNLIKLQIVKLQIIDDRFGRYRCVREIGREIDLEGLRGTFRIGKCRNVFMEGNVSRLEELSCT